MMMQVKNSERSKEMDEKDMNQDALKKEEEKVLCGANSYREQYFFNPRFSLLPKEVQESLQKSL